MRQSAGAADGNPGALRFGHPEYRFLWLT